ncbi:MAG: hypothetical protein KKC20_19705 [Proteobacteria bacterium]|nr:hypothetical protein [Pseudomonadota bacterium]
MPLSENALNAYKRLYFAERYGESNPTKVHRRVAQFAASAEPGPTNKILLEGVFFDMVESNQFRPNSPIMGKHDGCDFCPECGSQCG